MNQDIKEVGQNPEEQKFRADLALSVDKAFENRVKLTYEKEGREKIDNPEDDDYRGVYESSDPRAARLITDGNRVVVQNLLDYELLLRLGFSKTIRDPERAAFIAATVLDEKRREPFNPHTQEKRYAVDFVETADGYPGITPSSVVIRKGVPASYGINEGETTHRRELTFVSQHDPHFQYAVDAGILPDLKNSNLCWLAGVEIALSAFIKDEQTRNNVMKSLVNEIKDSGNFNWNGGFNSQKLEGLVSGLNKVLGQNNVPVGLKYFDDIVFDDIANKQRDGSVVLFAMADAPGEGHVMVMSDIVKEKGEQVFFQTYDPGAPDVTAGSKITDNFTIFREHHGGNFRMLPFLITVNQT